MGSGASRAANASVPARPTLVQLDSKVSFDLGRDSSRSCSDLRTSTRSFDSDRASVRSFAAPTARKARDSTQLPIPPHKLCFHSNAGFRGVSKKHKSGTEKVNQDCGFLGMPVADNYHQMLLAVYDGHGRKGEQLSQFAANTMFEELEEVARATPDDTPEVLLRRATAATDERMREEMPSLAQRNGTTMIAALLSPQSISVACVGDSRCVIGRARQAPAKGWEAVPMSVDQTAAIPEEAARVTSAGGKVQLVGGRMEVQHAELGCALAMSRSLGDLCFESVGVTSAPEITNSEIKDEDVCLVLASDGLWEVVDSQAAIDICFKHKKLATEACTSLIKQATKLWHKSRSSYIDDITVVVAFLQDLQAPKKKNSFVQDLMANLHQEAPKEQMQPAKKRSLVEGLYATLQESPPGSFSRGSASAAESEAVRPPSFAEAAHGPSYEALLGEPKATLVSVFQAG